MLREALLGATWLMHGRHLDQLLLCSVYGVCKVGLAPISSSPSSRTMCSAFSASQDALLRCAAPSSDRFHVPSVRWHCADAPEASQSCTFVLFPFSLFSGPPAGASHLQEHPGSLQAAAQRTARDLQEREPAQHRGHGSGSYAGSGALGRYHCLLQQSESGRAMPVLWWLASTLRGTFVLCGSLGARTFRPGLLGDRAASCGGESSTGLRVGRLRCTARTPGDAAKLHCTSQLSKLLGSLRLQSRLSRRCTTCCTEGNAMRFWLFFRCSCQPSSQCCWLWWTGLSHLHPCHPSCHR